MKRIAVHALVLVSMLLVGCTAVDQVSREVAPPPPGKALVYVYRLDTWPAVRDDALFSVNGTSVVALAANSYTWFYLPEGNYRLEQRWDSRYVPKVAHLDFSVRAGSTYYLRLNVEGEVRQMKWWLSNVAATSAMDEISKCRFQAPQDANVLKLSPRVKPSEA